MAGTDDDRSKSLHVRLLVLIGLLIFELAACAALTQQAFLPLGSFHLLWWLSALIALTLVFLIAACWKLVRNRFQFSLASFLIAVLVLGAGLGTLISFLQRSQRQREAAARLESLGASIRWQNQGEPGLKEYLGRRYFEDVIGVDFLGWPNVTDEEIALLGDLPGLRDLSLFGHRFTDENLRCLEGLAQLETLTITSVNVKGPGIRSLQGLSELRVLEFVNSPLGDAEAEMLSRCTQLETLGVAYSHIGDDGVAHLKRLSSLKALYLHGTAVTNNGLRHLAELPNLRVLQLGSTAVSDVGLVHLKEWERLENLSLYGTQVTDDGLRHLESLQCLKNLGLEKTKVTDEGVARLREKLPNCEIVK